MAIAGPLKLKLQLMRGDEPAIGPGKALVLDAIDHHGSITAAGRELGMSYRRTWLLVDSLNRCWTEPAVETQVGGGSKGGARLTEFGRGLLINFRAIEAEMLAAISPERLAWLTASLRPTDAKD